MALNKLDYRVQLSFVKDKSGLFSKYKDSDLKKLNLKQLKSLYKKHK